MLRALEVNADFARMWSGAERGHRRQTQRKEAPTLRKLRLILKPSRGTHDATTVDTGLEKTQEITDCPMPQ